ncbi:hypothetical protein A8990_14536 [Paenibacillus taihuensis]|uniref:Uncharacterized protein n=1 Tax=Paenibacillus taihuensis TaxID=1156355 RepID=A0A3D9R192_9BACL|nr:hypothetical protein A8990_14536 [Paenibacillus taihuensis]
MRTKWIIGSLILIIAVLGTILCFTIMKTDTSDRKNDTILYHFDLKDVNRLNELVERHNNGKGDYLMLIPPIIDSGYVINDVHSDGKEVTWTYIFNAIFHMEYQIMMYLIL